MNKNILSKTANKGFFGEADCFKIIEESNLNGAILVLKPEFLLRPYNVPEYQFVLCREDRGNYLFVEFIKDDTTTLDYEREDFVGVIKPWRLPGWVTDRMRERPQRRAHKLNLELDRAKRMAIYKATAVIANLGIIPPEDLEELNNRKTKRKMSSIYRRSYKDAERCGRYEMLKYTESFKMNVECALFIKNAVNADYDGSNLMRTAAEYAVKTYGYARTYYVLSNTVQHFKEDKAVYTSIPKEICSWSELIPITADFADGDRTMYFAADCLVSQLVCFINNVFDVEHDAEKEKRRQTELRHTERKAKKAARKAARTVQVKEVC